MPVDPIVLLTIIAALGPIISLAAWYARGARRARKFLTVRWMDSPRRSLYRDTNWDSLTTREKQIIALVAEGKRNAEIGRELALTTHTVGNYLYDIYQKLGVRNRAELIRVAHEHVR